MGLAARLFVFLVGVSGRRPFGRAGTGRQVVNATDKVKAIIEPSLETMGFEVVRVQLTGGDRPTLQIMAERSDRGEMTVDHCATISRTVSALLDVEDPIDSAYYLEVSSPGIDRPLTRLADFERFAGFEAKLEARAAIDGRRRFRGALAGCDGDRVLIVPSGEDEPVAIRFEDLAKAKLVLTDALIAASTHAQNDEHSSRQE